MESTHTGTKHLTETLFHITYMPLRKYWYEYKWDWTTEDSFTETKYAKVWPRYWEVKKRAVNEIDREKRLGIFTDHPSFDIHFWGFGMREMIIQTPELPHHVNVDLLKGMLLYDVLVYDSTRLERDLIFPFTSSDEKYEREKNIKREEAVRFFADLMEEKILIPIQIRESFSEKDDEDLYRWADHIISQDPEFVELIDEWGTSGDWSDAKYFSPEVLSSFLWSVLYAKKFNAQKFNVGLVNSNSETPIYHRLFKYFNRQYDDTREPATLLQNILNIEIPLFETKTIDYLKQVKKDRSVERFRNKIWNYINKYSGNILEKDFVNEIYDAREEVKEVVASISGKKLIWSVIAILTTPFLGIPFPLNVAVSLVNLGLKELVSKIYLDRRTEKFKWVLIFEKIRKYSREEKTLDETL